MILSRVLLLPVCMAMIVNVGFAQQIFYVSTDGDDDGQGSIEHPFRTLEFAIQQGIKTDADSIEIILRGGVYFRSSSLILDGSRINKPMEISTYKGERVSFHGGQIINGKKFTLVRDRKVLSRLLPEVRDKVSVVNLNELGISDYGRLNQHGFGTISEPAPLELFIDGDPQILARYPNDESLLMIGKVEDTGSIPRRGDFSNRGAEFGFEYDRPIRWKKANDVWLHGKFSVGYADDHIRVKEIDYKKSTFKMQHPHLYGVRTSMPKYMDGDRGRAGLTVRGYYAYNLLEEIDSVGEYYLDRETGMLYVYPNADLSNSKIEVSILEDPLISIVNAGEIAIEGIDFTCARGMGVYLENSSDVSIDKCSFSNLGTVGVSMGQAFQDNTKQYHLDGSPKQEAFVEGDFSNVSVGNSKFFNLGNGGMILSGGDRKTLDSARNEVFNCEFYKTGRINHAYTPPIKLYGVGNIIRNCYFHDLRHQAIAISGNDHLIEYSRFDKACLETDDMGAIYGGRDPSSRGTVIQYNYFSNIEPSDTETSMAGIYIDDGSGGMTIKNNFFYKVGNPGHYENFAAVFYHGGHDMKLLENTFMDCQMAVGSSPWDERRWVRYLESDMIRNKVLEEVNINDEIYLSRYPELKSFLEDYGRRLNLAQNNLLIRTPLVKNGDFKLRDNNILESDVVQPEKIRFEEAMSFFRSFEAFPFEKCGIIDTK